MAVPLRVAVRSTGDIAVHTREPSFYLLSLAICVVMASTWSANAQSPADEPALAWAADDPRLQWGPCPSFLPEGCRIAVLHGDPAKSNADVFFKVPAKSKLPLHWHSSAERIVLVAGELHVTYEGQEAAILKAGTYAYGPAKRPHSGLCASSVPCVLFIAFESPVDAVPGAGSK
ncbi:MAG TPA: cupin domain-containing protein [Steroidobacteraceae bacterium]|nr:cupin domain-containing protein [Steroidobacteraceae bacterium]